MLAASRISNRVLQDATPSLCLKASSVSPVLRRIPLANNTRTSIASSSIGRGLREGEFISASLQHQRRHYSVLSKEEEEKEKARVAALSPYEREMELRALDAKISRLHTLRGINSGELYTMRGKFKFLAKEYGMGFMMWYWTVWTTTAILTYGSIELLDVDAIALLAKVDGWTGYDISSKVDPTLGTIGLTIAVNELLEPLRLPIVVFTTKPVVDTFSRR